MLVQLMFVELLLHLLPPQRLVSVPQYQLHHHHHLYSPLLLLSFLQLFHLIHHRLDCPLPFLPQPHHFHLHHPPDWLLLFLYCHHPLHHLMLH